MPNGKTLSVIVKALRVVLYDLVPGTKYEFKVRTVLDANASPFSKSVFNRTFETGDFKTLLTSFCITVIYYYNNTFINYKYIGH